MRLAKPLVGLALLVAAAACATASVSYSNVTPGKQPVSAKSSKFNVLGLTPTPMERLTQLRDSLSAQCGNRGVTGIVAKTSTVFVIIGVIEKTEVTGYCAGRERDGGSAAPAVDQRRT
jgi:hypothetical protein